MDSVVRAYVENKPYPAITKLFAEGDYESPITIWQWYVGSWPVPFTTCTIVRQKAASEKEASLNALIESGIITETGKQLQIGMYPRLCFPCVAFIFQSLSCEVWSGGQQASTKGNSMGEQQLMVRKRNTSFKRMNIMCNFRLLYQNSYHNELD